MDNNTDDEVPSEIRHVHYDFKTSASFVSSSLTPPRGPLEWDAVCTTTRLEVKGPGPLKRRLFCWCFTQTWPLILESGQVGPAASIPLNPQIMFENYVAFID